MWWLVERLTDILAPPRCLRCLTENTWWCSRCSLSLKRPYLSCIGCHTLNPHGRTCATCRAAYPLTGVISVGSYTTPYLRRGIHWLKYKNVRTVAPILAEMLLPSLLTIAPWPDLQRQALLIPIPLHHRRQRLRGFNQSQDIAAHLARISRIPLVPLLVRHQSTWTQSHLPKEMRTDNMQNAFRVETAPDPSKKILLLVDDVTTSGSTFVSAAMSLRTWYLRNGLPFPHIWGCAIARG